MSNPKLAIFSRGSARVWVKRPKPSVNRPYPEAEAQNWAAEAMPTTKNVCAGVKKAVPRKGNSLVVLRSLQCLFVAVLVDLNLQGLDVVGVRRNLDISVILVQVALVVDDCRFGDGPQGVVDGDAEYTLRILYVSRLAVLRVAAVALVVEIVVCDNPVIVEVVALVGAGVGGTRTFGARRSSPSSTVGRSIRRSCPSVRTCSLCAPARRGAARCRRARGHARQGWPRCRPRRP